MKRYTQLLVVFHFVLLGFNPQALAHIDISIPDANDMISSDDNRIVIDVRERKEYCGSLGHVPGAYNYPWDSGILQALYNHFSLDDEIFVICSIGSRSDQAANFLDSEGYLYIYDIFDGTYDWKNTYGYDTVGCVDSDGDGINDDLDNCPDIYNSLQTDSDSDRTGNACDNDCPNLDELNPVDMVDLATLAANWQRSGPDLAGDLDFDELVDIHDLIIFANYWLSECYE